MDSSIADELKKQVAAFRQQHGHAPRVLHIGNIANNAYVNAKLLNEIGFDCDVLCYNYYHIMGCPEWEDADFTGKISDQNFPDWHSVELNGYLRPKWFAQGLTEDCIKYLMARRKNQIKAADYYWNVLENGRRIVSYRKLKKVNKKFYARARYLPERVVAQYLLLHAQYTSWKPVVRPFLSPGKAAESLARKLLNYMQSKNYHQKTGFSQLLGVTQSLCKAVFGLLRFVFYTIAVLYHLVILALVVVVGLLQLPFSLIYRICRHSQKKKNKKFVDKIHKGLSSIPLPTGEPIDLADLRNYLQSRPYLNPLFELFQEYDIIHGYSIDPIYPMLIRNKPYVAYEHGTIREIPFQNDLTGKLTYLSYHLADAVMVTNADNLKKAHHISQDVERVVHALHGFDDRKITRQLAQVEERMPRSEGRFGFSDDIKVFFAPARHHPEKGNEKIIEAIKMLREEGIRNFRVVFAEWGQTIEESKDLIKKLGIEDVTLWVEPLGKMELMNAYRSVDCVMDQFYIPCTGGLCIETMLVGRCPVITYLDDEMIARFFGETMPVFNAFTSAEVADAMKKVLFDPQSCQKTIRASQAWMRKYHSHIQTLEKLLEAYRIAGLLKTGDDTGASQATSPQTASTQEVCV